MRLITLVLLFQLLIIELDAQVVTESKLVNEVSVNFTSEDFPIRSTSDGTNSSHAIISDSALILDSMIYNNIPNWSLLYGFVFEGQQESLVIDFSIQVKQTITAFTGQTEESLIYLFIVTNDSFQIGSTYFNVQQDTVAGICWFDSNGSFHSYAAYPCTNNAVLDTSGGFLQLGFDFITPISTHGWYLRDKGTGCLGDPDSTYLQYFDKDFNLVHQTSVVGWDHSAVLSHSGIVTPEKYGFLKINGIWDTLIIQGTAFPDTSSIALLLDSTGTILNYFPSSLIVLGKGQLDDNAVLCQITRPFNSSGGLTIGNLTLSSEDETILADYTPGGGFNELVRIQSSAWTILPNGVSYSLRLHRFTNGAYLRIQTPPLNFNGMELTNESGEAETFLLLLDDSLKLISYDAITFPRIHSNSLYYIPTTFLFKETGMMHYFENSMFRDHQDPYLTNSFWYHNSAHYADGLFLDTAHGPVSQYIFKTTTGRNVFCGAYVDSNSNGSFDGNESLIPNWKFQLNGQHVFSSLSQSSSITVTAPSDSFWVASSARPGTTISPDSMEILVPNPGDLDSALFAIEMVGTYPDVAVQILAPSLWIGSGPPLSMRLLIENRGNTTEDVQVVLVVDSLFLNSGPTPDSVVGDSHYFQINNLTPLSTQSLPFTLDVNGQSLLNVSSLISISADSVPQNNGDDHSIQSRFAYDPNFKTASRSIIEVDEYDTFKELTYYVQFQNTGDTSAVNIYVWDTLSNYLDYNTFEFVESSHPCEVTLKGSRLLVEYPDIYLPDSSMDYEASIGWFVFRIKMTDQLDVGDSTVNRVGIYFDENPVVLTNYATTVIVDDIIGLNEKNDALSELKFFPNPSNGMVKLQYDNGENAELKLYDIQGRLLFQKDIAHGINTIDLSLLNSGSYPFVLTSIDGSVWTGKIIRE